MLDVINYTKTWSHHFKNAKKFMFLKEAKNACLPEEQKGISTIMVLLLSSLQKIQIKI